MGFKIFLDRFVSFSPTSIFLSSPPFSLSLFVIPYFLSLLYSIFRRLPLLDFPLNHSSMDIVPGRSSSSLDIVNDGNATPFGQRRHEKKEKKKKEKREKRFRNPDDYREACFGVPLFTRQAYFRFEYNLFFHRDSCITSTDMEICAVL